MKNLKLSKDFYKKEAIDIAKEAFSEAEGLTINISDRGDYFEVSSDNREVSFEFANYCLGIMKGL